MGLGKAIKRTARKAVSATKRYANPIKTIKRSYGNVREGVEEQSKRLRRTAKGWGPEAVRWGATTLGTAAGAMVGQPMLGYQVGSQLGGAYANRVAARKAEGASKEQAALEQEYLRSQAAGRMVRRDASRQAGAGQIKYVDESMVYG